MNNGLRFEFSNHNLLANNCSVKISHCLEETLACQLHGRNAFCGMHCFQNLIIKSSRQSEFVYFKITSAPDWSCDVFRWCLNARISAYLCMNNSLICNAFVLRVVIYFVVQILATSVFIAKECN